MPPRQVLIGLSKVTALQPPGHWRSLSAVGSYHCSNGKAVVSSIQCRCACRAGRAGRAFNHRSVMFCKSVCRSRCKRASRRGKKQGADFPDISTDQNPIKTLNSLHGSARLVVTKHWWFALKFERHIKLKGMSLPNKKRDTCLSNLNGNMKH